MVRRTGATLVLLLSVVAICASSFAQPPRTITVRVLNSRTGALISTADFLVRVNHEETVHGNWVVENEDGTGKLTVPDTATVLSLEARYDMGMSIYLNCDSVKDKDHTITRWYTVADILTSGVAAPNRCGKRTAVAKPGEFVFFVRKPNWAEQMKDDTY